MVTGKAIEIVNKEKNTGMGRKKKQVNSLWICLIWSALKKKKKKVDTDIF